MTYTDIEIPEFDHAVARKMAIDYALSLWPDTRQDQITREDAALIADAWRAEAARLPLSLSAEWIEGWQAACDTIAMALRFKAYHL